MWGSFGKMKTKVTILAVERRLRKNWKLLTWFAAVALVCWAVPTIIEHYAATDNVRELFRTDRKHVLPSHTWFVLLCLSVPLSARFALRLIQKRCLWLAATVALVSPIAGWFCLRFSVTVESIHDILGSMQFGWPYDLEYMLRFSVVYLGLWLLVLLGLLPNPLKKRPHE